MGVALTAGTNMGIRHVLPIYPFLILAAAAGAWALARRHQAWAIVVAALLAFHLASSLHTLPDYLAYSNELFGGKSQTYRYLSDSNVDWGQGMREAGHTLSGTTSRIAGSLTSAPPTLPTTIFLARCCLIPSGAGGMIPYKSRP